MLCVPLRAPHVLLCEVSSLFYFLWEVLLFPGALLLGFVLVFAWCVEPLVFGIESAGLFENPTVSVGMVSRLPGSTVYMTYPVQDFI